MRDAKDLLYNPHTGCAQFVSDLLATLSGRKGSAYTTDPAHLFDDLGIVFRDEPFEDPNDSGHATGSRATDNATMEIAPPGTENASYYYAIAAIHEAIHLAAKRGRYNDYQVASAIFRMGASEKALPDRKMSGRALVNESSKYFDEAMREKCPFPVR